MYNWHILIIVTIEDVKMCSSGEDLLKQEILIVSSNSESFSQDNIQPQQASHDDAGKLNFSLLYTFNKSTIHSLIIGIVPCLHTWIVNLLLDDHDMKKMREVNINYSLTVHVKEMHTNYNRITPILHVKFVLWLSSW